MRLLLIHQNFPGQFRHVAPLWARRLNWDVLGLGRDTAPGLPEVRWLKYSLHRDVGDAQHHYLRQMESAVLHGQAVARGLQKLKSSGYKPDVIFAHPGWGETLYARDIFPHARVVHFCEWFYGTTGSDTGFDAEFPNSFDGRAKLRTWNALHLLNLDACDAGVSPTAWQKSRHPAIYQPKIHQIHEGIDTDLLTPDPNAKVKMPCGVVLRAGEPIVTYVARNLEPYRGFHSFMRALERVQKAHPHCHAIIVGGDEVSYGHSPQNAAHWREKMLREVKLDASRTHFVGKVPYDTYRQILQVSAAHVYLTYPFVLSWSMLEAMASGCLVVGSRTAPVQEVIAHGVNGLLVDFFNPVEISSAVAEALESPRQMQPLRERARRDVADRYSLQQGEAAYTALLLGSESRA
jgi:glycosyltransferase involved in cell wall biosynthesis